MRLEALFNPKSIAVVGASTKKGNVGNDIVKNLTTQGFGGAIYPINPHATELYGKRCYATLSEIIESVELAIIAVPVSGVMGVVRESIQKGVDAIIIISAGFREVGNVKTEEAIRLMCNEADIALLGPNCLGVIHPQVALNASFAPHMPKAGSLAFLSQSGALCTAMLDYMRETSFGFSKFVSLGNKAQIDEVTLLQFLKEDAETEIILLYLEQLTHPKEFIDVVQALHQKGKPVFIIKSGNTLAGSNASASHTGSLAGNDAVYDAVFEKAGAIRVRNLDDFFEYISGFFSKQFPQGDRVAVLTNAGGPGVLVTDEIILQGLSLAELSEDTKMALQKFLPTASNTRNPIDLLGDADAARYEKSLNILLKDPNVDSIITVLTPQSMTEIVKTAQALVNISKTSKKTILASFMGSTDILPGMRILEESRVPVSRFPQKLAQTLAVMRKFIKITRDKEEHFQNIPLKKEGVQRILKNYPEGGNMSFEDALRLFEMYGFSVTKSRLIKDGAEAREAVLYVGGMAVFKIISPDIVHKSDVGGVTLRVTPENAQREYENMITRIMKNVPRARIDGILVAEMIVERGVEFILGTIKDPNLGHAVMVGLGGIYVEVFRDVAFGLVPVSRNSAKTMIEKLKSKALLRGARGGEILDEEELLQGIGRMSKILEENPNIAEADINPLILFSQGKGMKVTDARITIIPKKIKKKIYL